MRGQPASRPPLALPPSPLAPLLPLYRHSTDKLLQQPLSLPCFIHFPQPLFVIPSSGKLLQRPPFFHHSSQELCFESQSTPHHMLPQDPIKEPPRIALLPVP